MHDEDFPPLDLSRKDLPGPLTPDAYAAAAGTHCPACEGTTLFPGDFTRRGMLAVTQHGTCAHCGATWTAVYELTGYEGLCVPQEEPHA